MCTDEAFLKLLKWCSRVEGQQQQKRNHFQFSALTLEQAGENPALKTLGSSQLTKLHKTKWKYLWSKLDSNRPSPYEL